MDGLGNHLSSLKSYVPSVGGSRPLLKQEKHVESIALNYLIVRVTDFLRKLPVSRNRKVGTPPKSEAQHEINYR